MNVDDREWNLNQLLFADDSSLVPDSKEKLCQLVEEFGQMCISMSIFFTLISTNIFRKKKKKKKKRERERERGMHNRYGNFKAWNNNSHHYGRVEVRLWAG